MSLMQFMQPEKRTYGFAKLQCLLSSSLIRIANQKIFGSTIYIGTSSLNILVVLTRNQLELFLTPFFLSAAGLMNLKF